MIFAAANAEDSNLDDAEGEDDASIQKRKTMNDANPDNAELRKWLDDALDKFDSVYGQTRPGFLEGYKSLKETIQPWGA